MEYNPPFINVTCHRDEEEYVPNDDGTFSKLTLAKRPSTLAIVAAIMQKFDVDIVPHVICGGSSKTKIESELLDLNFLGIHNVVALRGDAMPGQQKFMPEKNGFAHSCELVKMITNLNNAKYLDPSVKNGMATDFCIGVAGYPEKHFEAANLKHDVVNLKRKVDAGADYVVTQMFFDNEKYYRFVDLCRAEGINVPIIPGIKPLSTPKQLEALPRAFHLDLPEDLTAALDGVSDRAKVFEIGVEWCIAQCKDLIAHGVPAIHFYTMGKAENVKRVVEAVF
jgi:methylenetetrahydrofolate reductase (NADPH)